jgi:hypothetical protein
MNSQKILIILFALVFEATSKQFTGVTSVRFIPEELFQPQS